MKKKDNFVNELEKKFIEIFGGKGDDKTNIYTADK